MVDPIFITQDIFLKTYPPIETIHIRELALTDSFINHYFGTTNMATQTLGLSGKYGNKSKLSSLAIATDTHVIVIQLSLDLEKIHKRRQSARRLLQDRILCNTKIRKLAFDVERLATTLFLDHEYRMNNTVDIQSLFPGDTSRESTITLLASLGGKSTLNMAGVQYTFQQVHKDDRARNKALTLRAWSACIISSLPRMSALLCHAKPIDTSNIPSSELEVLGASVRDYERIVALKPIKVRNDINPSGTKFSKGHLRLDLARFKTRMRLSETQKIAVQFNGDEASTVFGRVTHVKGKSARVSLNTGNRQGDQIRVTTLGKDDPTNAERERINIILACLQQRDPFLKYQFAACVFFGQEFPPSPDTISPPIYFPNGCQLNRSQMKAVNCILSNASSDRVCLIQGPPGTGKTTVITAGVHSFLADRTSTPSIWLMAQSNVAVKKIAEKLADSGFLDFKILVSLDFHFEWHEHLYKQIERNVIVSDLFSRPTDVSRRVEGTRVILCTLSALSHPKLASSGILQIAPIETVILDEVSQIEVGCYFPLLSRFGQGLRKLVFIGDDKQLAPFGQDDIGNLRSVFELDHFQHNVVFLDTQYRMPCPLGDFLSRHVYDNKLKSIHPLKTRKSCRLVDIERGREASEGASWVNYREIQAVVRIARRYAGQRKTYRIITPYDAQREEIEKALKEAGLEWEDKCFNVDSFQGNEADHIILSVVRSDKVGFLQNIRRSNVMLSRCKRSMMICTSRKYLEGVATETLLGKLAKEWERDGQKWLTWKDILAYRF